MSSGSCGRQAQPGRVLYHGRRLDEHPHPDHPADADAGAGVGVPARSLAAALAWLVLLLAGVVAGFVVAGLTFAHFRSRPGAILAGPGTVGSVIVGLHMLL